MPIDVLIEAAARANQPRGEHIAAAAHRFDHCRFFQLAPNPPDLNVDRPVFRPGLAITGEIEQLVPTQHLIGVVDEGREQIEFAGGDLDLLVRRRIELPAQKIESPAGEPCPRLRRCLPLGGPSRGPAQHALDRSQQLTQVERFWQIDIRTHFEADDAVENLALTGQNDDPDARFIAQRASKGQSVLSRQHQIEDDKINGGLRHDPAHLGAIMRGRNPVTLAGVIFPDEIADLAFIVDNQDVSVVQLRLPNIMVRPRRQIGGRVPGRVSQTSLPYMVTNCYTSRLPFREATATTKEPGTRPMRPGNPLGDHGQRAIALAVRLHSGWFGSAALRLLAFSFGLGPRMHALACYTRKSSEEGLEQEFNSLQAQREACEAFIESQRQEGWVCLRAAYDDGGFSGARMDWPALQRLLADSRRGGSTPSLSTRSTG